MRLRSPRTLTRILRHMKRTLILSSRQVRLLFCRSAQVEAQANTDPWVEAQSWLSILGHEDDRSTFTSVEHQVRADVDQESFRRMTSSRLHLVTSKEIPKVPTKASLPQRTSVPFRDHLPTPPRDKAYQYPGMRQKQWFLAFLRTVPHLGSTCIGARTMRPVRSQVTRHYCQLRRAR
ncbi:uncharacterized protein K444DRAFT_87607 [Hyaloscypha bicolor E]|uniref:Uncharacterized protein n=1 Tax=Hyaloscypha bicolor E TaxID=1095630 RepID=A0A2J6SX83_9HELO|nr:uncharacterized protein K444DRAFT_87607 [Hyaloscypha bicolor E]PMD55386.1 hypothetical protein K444DRAFT_87607 [Hyaloscypha bicolor E]